MNALTLNQKVSQPLPTSRVSRVSLPKRWQYGVIQAYKKNADSHDTTGANKGESGIHDPLGWGSKVRISKKHDAGIQEQSKLYNQRLHTKVMRSEARKGTKQIDSKVSRKPIDSELAEIKKEQQQQQEKDEEAAVETQDHMASRDEQEWQSMNAMQRLALEGENALYGWLLTGYEPL